MPRSAPAQLRADMRRVGVRRTARQWGISGRNALLIAAGLEADRKAVAACIRRVLARLEAHRG